MNCEKTIVAQLAYKAAFTTTAEKLRLCTDVSRLSSLTCVRREKANALRSILSWDPTASPLTCNQHVYEKKKARFATLTGF